MSRALPKVHRDGSVTLHGVPIGTVRQCLTLGDWEARYKGGLVATAKTRALAVDVLRRHELRRYLRGEAQELAATIARSDADRWTRGYAYGICRAVRDYAVEHDAARELLYDAAEAAGLTPNYREAVSRRPGSATAALAPITKAVSP